MRTGRVEVALLMWSRLAYGKAWTAYLGDQTEIQIQINSQATDTNS